MEVLDLEHGNKVTPSSQFGGMEHVTNPGNLPSTAELLV